MNLRINRQERIHSLDALRAIMMLLGIVLHATEPYSLGTDALWPKDPNARGLSLNYIFGIIHIFRMPVFFLIAASFRFGVQHLKVQLYQRKPLPDAVVDITGQTSSLQ